MTHTHDRRESAAPPRPSPEDLKDFRWFADEALLPSVCPRGECRRGKRCRGPLKIPEFYSDHPLPFCLAEAFDRLYEPVVRWFAMKKQIGQMVAMLNAKGPPSR